ncbi:MAG: hypothetical protein FWH26_05880 [Oscillospiraceae bacterium]|nr:hypothetical protein [Oscillospiraceae bacterium]
MKEDYVPNEKYRNMFGVERNGYGMERVDLYLAQLEVAFKKIREDNRALKREFAEQSARHAAGGAGLAAGPNTGSLPPLPQGIPAAPELQEANLALRAQLADIQEQNRALHAQLSEQDDLRLRMQDQTEGLMSQIAALRGEADDLRQRLRLQPPQQQMTGPIYEPQHFEPPYAEAQPPRFEDEKQSLIGKVLIEARAQADETVRAARSEADQILRKARQRADELRAEQERITSQLQSIQYALRTVLRDSVEPDYKRGEEFAVS